jgi:hypothetical protein
VLCSGSSAVAVAAAAVQGPVSATSCKSDAPVVEGGESPDSEIIAAMATVLQQQQQHRSSAAVVHLTDAAAAAATAEQLEHTAAVQERAEAALEASHIFLLLQLLAVHFNFCKLHCALRSTLKMHCRHCEVGHCLHCCANSRSCSSRSIRT